MARSLSVLTSLRILHLSRGPDPALFDPLILANQETLFDMECDRLPTGVMRMPKMSWLKLQEDLSDAAAAAVCGPKLESLTLEKQSSRGFLRLLSSCSCLERMYSIGWEFAENVSLHALVSVVSRMASLGHLGLSTTCDLAAGERAAVRRLFRSSWTKLESFHFTCECFPLAVCVDEELGTLVQKNPQLTVVMIDGLRVTSAGLDCLSRLPQLKDLHLFLVEAETQDQLITTEAILSFLRGSSRHSLKWLWIMIRGEVGVHPHLDSAALKGEVALINKERGTKLKTEVKKSDERADFRIR